VKVPGKDFNIRISSLTDTELFSLIPALTALHQNLVGAAFNRLLHDLKSWKIERFGIDDLVAKIR
jgi:hypothetical protein